MTIIQKTSYQNTKAQICDLAWLKSNNKDNNLKHKRNINTIDLFCGCGGLSLGLEEGFKWHQIKTRFLLALDSNKNALDVYSENFEIEDKALKNLDIQELLNKPQLIKEYEQVDLLVAGPPCQGYSSLNNYTRAKDERNLLYLATLEFIQNVLPKVAIIENVSNVVNDNNKVVEQSIKLLNSLGYKTHELIIDTYFHFGLPQTRKRHLLIAILMEDFNIENIISEANYKHSLEEYIRDIAQEYKAQKSIYCTSALPNETNKQRIKYLFEKKLFDLPNEMRPKCHQKKHSYKSMYGRLNWDLPAQTITSGFGSAGQGRYIHPSEPRTITPHEAARIQGFPDFFSFNSVQSRVQLQKMIANAVPPKIMAVIIDELVQQRIL